MANSVPQVLANYEMYLDGARKIGVVTVTMPTVNRLRAEIKGAGISGVVSAPIQGHTEDMNGTIAFRTITSESVDYLNQGYNHFEFWGGIQELDRSTNKYVYKQHKVLWMAMPANLTIGQFAVGELQNREVEFNITVLREWHDNKETLHIDKFNYIDSMGGKDALAGLKSAIGL